MRIHIYFLFFILLTISCKNSIKEEKQEKSVVDLPLSKEDIDSGKNPNNYPNISRKKQAEIESLISKFKSENIIADNIIQINNNLDFDMFIYFVTADSSYSEIVNIDPKKGILDIELISYEYPEDETYETFLIDKDYSITIYEVNYETAKKEVLEKYQIKKSGQIELLFSNRKEPDNSNATAPN